MTLDFSVPNSLFWFTSKYKRTLKQKSAVDQRPVRIFITHHLYLCSHNLPSWPFSLLHLVLRSFRMATRNLNHSYTSMLDHVKLNSPFNGLDLVLHLDFPTKHTPSVAIWACLSTVFQDALHPACLWREISPSRFP